MTTTVGNTTIQIDLLATRQEMAAPIINALGSLVEAWDNVTLPNGFTASHVVKGLEERRRLLTAMAVLAGAMPEPQREEGDDA